MSNKVTKAIAEAEEQRGRPLSAVERMNVARSIPKADDSKERMRIILEETLAGIEAVNNFHAQVEAAKLSSGISERHKAAHEFESVKRSLLQKFNKGEIERIKPVKEAA